MHFQQTLFFLQFVKFRYNTQRECLRNFAVRLDHADLLILLKRAMRR